MASKSQSGESGPATVGKSPRARSRKVRAPDTTHTKTEDRAGSAGGVLLREEDKRESPRKITTSAPTSSDATASPSKTRRKPRKLNRNPISPSTESIASPAADRKADIDATATVELEALKSRVRGLEAKVEQLCSSADARKTRSPRRRGKGRKASSSTNISKISSPANSTANAPEAHEVGEADEELARLEGELVVARRDLEAYPPRSRRRRAPRVSEAIEEIPRDTAQIYGPMDTSDSRHVTLSGSYRIPLPTSVSMDDVKTIQNGVSAAQNVARSLLEQRRLAAAATSRDHHDPSTQSKSPLSSSRKSSMPRSLGSSMEIAVATDEGGEKQSWGDWIGGYSMAITRAVKSIEHEAAVRRPAAEGMEQGAANASLLPQTQPGRLANKSVPKRNVRKSRAPAKSKLSSEQVQGLLS